MSLHREITCLHGSNEEAVHRTDPELMPRAPLPGVYQPARRVYHARFARYGRTTVLERPLAISSGSVKLAVFGL